MNEPHMIAHVVTSGEDRKRIKYKKRLVGNLMKLIHDKRLKYKHIATYYKNVDDITDGLVSFCATATVTGVVIMYSNSEPVVKLVSGIFSGASLVITAIKKGINIRDKWSDSKLIYTQLSDLARETTIVLAKNHLSSHDLDNILTDLHHRLSLVEESEPMIGLLGDSCELLTTNDLSDSDIIVPVDS